MRTIAKSVLFHSMTALTGWAGFRSSSVGTVASEATCKKAEINENVGKILNICLYLRLLIRLLFVRTPVLRHAYLQTVRPREIFLIVIKKITSRWQVKAMTPLLAHTRDRGSLELATPILDLCTTPCVFRLITGRCTCFVSKAAFRSNAFIRFFVKTLQRFRHLVACYPAGRFLACGIQVEDRLATRLDHHANTDVSVVCGAGFDDVGPSW